MMTKTAEVLFFLLRQALGTNADRECPDLSAVSAGEWQEIIDLSFAQGVHAVSVDGYNNIQHRSAFKAPAADESLEDLMLDWFGSILESEEGYAHYVEVLSELSDIYSAAGMKMLLVKGYALALNYPVPAHRPTGDIDVCMGARGDDAIRGAGISVMDSYHKHSHFRYEGVRVENHHKFLDDVKHRSNIRFERILQTILHDGHYHNRVLSCVDRDILTPSATFNALYLLRHAGEHFAADRISVRHILDLGLFFCSHDDEIDWPVVLKIYMEEGMKQFYDAVGTLCVDYLGMDRHCFHGLDMNRTNASRVLDDIFRHSYRDMAPSRRRIISYGIFMTGRWWRNRWKYRMVYDESLLESFRDLALNRMMWRDSKNE